MRSVRKKTLALLTLGFCLGILPFFNANVVEADDEIIGPFFEIGLLVPNSCAIRNQHASLMADQFPKIGIGIHTFDHTGWAEISPRTWGWPNDTVIPTHSEGGFDLLFIGWSWGLDWNPIGLFESWNTPPVDDNFYQYNNSEYDAASINYSNSYNSSELDYWGKKLQSYLYDDLPQITVMSYLNLFAMDTDFTGWDSILWSYCYQSMENWQIPGQSEFHYATPADFEDFMIYKHESDYDAQWLNQIYNGLIERSANPIDNRQYTSHIASSWSTTDGVNYTVHLNPDAVWADGTPITTADVDFSYKLQITPAFGNPDFTYWSQYLRNNSVYMVDSDTCIISFNKTYMFQDGNLGLHLVPKHIWENIPYDQMEQQALNWSKDDPSKIFGAGPYKLHTYNGTTGTIRLTRNDYYDDWTGVTPYFDDIYFEFYSNKEGALEALVNGEIDMVDAQFRPQLEEVPAGTKYELVKEDGYQEMALNMMHPYFGTGALCPIAGEESARYVRKAMSHCVPREMICEELFSGLAEPGVTACPSIATVYNTSLEPYEYNLALALEYMKGAGYDVTVPSPTTSVGITLPIFMSILACIATATHCISKIIKRNF
ncbi:MAG: hypothetical protein FK733_16470 [Asgard group archaeon]|nr:hypothetical protein [Asgard group archaeon]